MSSGRVPAGLTLSAAWIAYAVFVAFAYPFTPFAALAMVVPLVLTGWHARQWGAAAAVGLLHGAALAGLGWWVGAFSAWGPDALGLAMALVVLLSWALTLAGWTMRVVHLLRWRTEDLEEARRQMQADAATVEAVYTASAAGLVGLDKEGTIVSWNPGAATIFGHPAAKAVGASIDLLAAVGHADDCAGRIRYVVDTGREMSTFSGKMRHAEGQALDVEVRPRTIMHPDGTRGALLTVVDRTREVVLGDEIARQAQQQDRIIHNLDEVLYSVAVPSMHPLMMSRSVEQLTGKSADEWEDFRAFLDLAHPDDREEVLRRWEHARSGEKSVLRWRLRTPLGGHAWVEDRVVPARDDDGRVVRVDGSIRRIFREVELERQAQRMMRWLDALEPMTGGGAWSIDLRNQSWQWSNGMRRILAIEQEPEDGLDAWSARLDQDSTHAFAALLGDPDNPHPLVLNIWSQDGLQPFVVEPWVQRGADGEPIWLYGIVRPQAPRRKRRRKRTETRHAAPQTEEPAREAGQVATLVPPAVETATVPPASPDVGRFIGEALARARETVIAAQTAEEADVLAAMDDAVAGALEHARHWARTARVPCATKGIGTDDVGAQVMRLAQQAERRAIDAALAAEQRAAEAIADRAIQAAHHVEVEAKQRIEAARRAALDEVEEARALAAAEAAKARESEQARLAANEEMERQIAAVQEAKSEALRQAEEARGEALRDAERAREQVKQEAAKAAKAEEARMQAEHARKQALQAAEEAKQKARAEADQARAEAMEQSEQAKRLAEQEAQKAREATAAMHAAQQSRKEALEAAEQARAKALEEAGETRASALKAAQAAQERAEGEAKKARAAEEARQKAEAAQARASAAAEAAKAKALQDADAARKEALQAATEAKQRAEREAEQARRAEAARKQAEEAQAAAMLAAEDATRRAEAEGKAREQAIAQAEKATAKAMAEAEKALAAARTEAARAEAAEQARIEAEHTVEAAVAAAQESAQQARQEAEQIKAEALEEAQRAKAAAKAEAAKAEQAEKALAAALKEAHAARDQAIHEAERARDEAIKEAERARDHAIHEVEAARDEAMRQLQDAQLRVEQAEAEAEQAWDEARAVAVEPDVLAAPNATGEAVAGEPEGHVTEAPPSQRGMDVVWDDEIGWIPRPRGSHGKDKAEQLKAKSWQGGSEPKKGSGPWALD